MLFKLFNLKEEITKHNKKHNTNFDENESFNFHYLFAENLNKANYYLDLINHGNETFIYSREGGRFVKELNIATRQVKLNLSHLSDPKRLSHGSIYNNTPFTPEEIRNLENENQKNKAWAEVIKKQANILFDETFWVINKKINNIEEIKRSWLKNSVLATFNDTAIYKIASESLPSLIAYQNEAFEELSKHKYLIPDDIYKAYQDYLKDFQERAKKMQGLLVESMLTRLKAYDVSKGAYSNPVIHIHCLIKPQFERPYQPSVLKPNEFNFYHQYIRLRGNYDQKKELYQRRWYTSLNNIPTKLIKTSDGNSLLVPEALAKDVPLKKGWPNWIFWAANIRYNLFKNNISLIAALKGRIEINYLFIDLTLPEPFIIALNEANNRDNQIKEALLQLEKHQPKYKLLSWFSPTTKEFLDGWKKILLEQQKTVVDDKIEIAKRLIDSFKKELINKELTKNIPWSAIDASLKLKDDLEKLIENDKTLEGKVYTIQTILIQIDRLTNCHKMLALTATGKNLNEDELNKLLTFVSNIKNEDKEIYTAFIEHNKPLFQKIKNNLVSELQVDPFSFKSAKERNVHHSTIVSSSTLLDKISDLNEYKELDDLILEYALNYLQQITTNNQKQNQVSHVHLSDNLLLAEQILKLIGGVALFQNKPLNIYLEDLQKEKALSKRTYEAKCSNLIKQLTIYFNDKALAAQLTILDDELIDLLKAPPFNYTDKVIERIMTIREKIINGKSLESLKLSVSDENLLGINNKKNGHIWALIKQSIQANQLKLTLKSHHVSYANKIREIAVFRKSFSKFIKNSIELPNTVKSKLNFNQLKITETFNQAEISLPTITV